MDSVYHWGMTISLMNAGRGAGKTYSLVQWAKESPNRYVIGSVHATGHAMLDAGLGDQFVHPSEGMKLRGRQNLEVAIDDFHLDLHGLLQQRYGIGSAVSVILATTLAEWDRAPKPVELSPEYIQNLKEQYPAMTTINTTVGLGDVVDAAMKLVSSPITEADIRKANPEAPAEPDTRKIPLSELRIGDRIVGKGEVVALVKLPGNDREVTVENQREGFTGTIVAPKFSVVEIEN